MKKSLEGFVEEISHESFLFRHIKKKVLKKNWTAKGTAFWIKDLTKTLDNASQ